MPSYILPDSVLANPASVKEGLSPDVEYNNRIFMCEMLAQAGMLLKL